MHDNQVRGGGGRSIKDQREDLPIFKLKQQLIAAVHDNQVWGGRMRAIMC